MCAVLSEKALKANIEVRILGRSLCEFDETEEFDLALCVFTVLNYLIREEDLRRFATASANALRNQGLLMVSFVTSMKLMQDFYKYPKCGKSDDGKIAVKRCITIEHKVGSLYQYREKSTVTVNRNKHSYEDKFPLREWSAPEIEAALVDAGLEFHKDVSQEFPSTGETYVVFRKRQPSSASGAKPSQELKTNPWRSKKIGPATGPRLSGLRLLLLRHKP
jgi:hypothetical protein